MGWVWASVVDHRPVQIIGQNTFKPRWNFLRRFYLCL
jgi:hypothetical protein